MSLILKGIDLPKNAKVQIIVESPTESFRKQIPKSKVIQIPKDHGRIIDEREAIRGWCKGCAFNDGICGKDETICEDKEMCKYAPTILESEEEI